MVSLFYPMALNKCNFLTFGGGQSACAGRARLGGEGPQAVVLNPPPRKDAISQNQAVSFGVNTKTMDPAPKTNTFLETPFWDQH